MAWAGRATIAEERDSAFVFYAIALESLFSKPRSRSGITHRLKTRAAWLLGTDRESRLRLANAIQRLYRRRSDIIHTGSGRGVSDADMQQITTLTRWAIGTLASNDEWLATSSESEVESWFDTQIVDPTELLSEENDARVTV